MNKTGGHNQMVQDEDAWFEAGFRKRWPLLDIKFFDEMQAVLDVGSETDGKGDWRERVIDIDREKEHATDHLDDSIVVNDDYVKSTSNEGIYDRDSGLSNIVHSAVRIMIARNKERGEK